MQPSNSNGGLESRLAAARQEFHDHIVQCVERGNKNEKDHVDIKRFVAGIGIIILTLFGYLLIHNHVMDKEGRSGISITRSSS